MPVPDVDVILQTELQGLDGLHAGNVQIYGLVILLMLQEKSCRFVQQGRICIFVEIRGDVLQNKVIHLGVLPTARVWLNLWYKDQNSPLDNSISTNIVRGPQNLNQSSFCDLLRIFELYKLCGHCTGKRA